MKLEKASVMSRILSGIADYFFVIAFMAVIFYLYGTPTATEGLEVSGLPGLAIIGFWFVWIVLPDLLFGRSFGNWVCDIRPVSMENPEEQLSLSRCLKRHIFDFIDLSWVGLLVIIINENNQRIGDQFAKTMVIKYKPL